MATATIKEAMLAGSGNFIQQEGYYDTWKQELGKYQETRTAWKEPFEPYVKRTHKDIKMRETSYNPVIQKYNNPVIEDKLAELERQAFIDVLAQNKVGAPRFSYEECRIVLSGTSRPIMLSTLRTNSRGSRIALTSPRRSPGTSGSAPRLTLSTTSCRICL